jgi:hypothetical protein
MVGAVSRYTIGTHTVRTIGSGGIGANMVGTIRCGAIGAYFLRTIFGDCLAIVHIGGRVSSRYTQSQYGNRKAPNQLSLHNRLLQGSMPVDVSKMLGKLPFSTHMQTTVQ